MTTTALIKEINKLPTNEKLLLVEKTLRSIRQEQSQSLEAAAADMYNEYKSNKELTIFTNIDSDSFYEIK